MRWKGLGFCVLLVSCLTAAAQDVGTAVFGRIIDAKGTVLSGTTVTLFPKACSCSSCPIPPGCTCCPAATVVAGESGEYSFKGIPPGSYELIGTLDGFRTKWSDITVTPAQSVSYDLRMDPQLLESFPATAAGVVYDTNSAQTVPKATVILKARCKCSDCPAAGCSCCPAAMVVYSDAKGYFELPVPPGRYDITLGSDSGQSAGTTIDVRPDSSTVSNVQVYKP